MGLVYVMEYLMGLAFFGLGYWLLDGIQVELQTVSETGNVYDLALYVWIGIIIIYLIFGGIWVVRKYSEKELQEGP